MLFVSRVNVAHADARVGMHQHCENKGMPSLRQSIVQPQPTTVHALPRKVCCAWPLCSASATERKHVTNKSPVGDISVVILIRTDTTIDHSQKAEKV